MKSERAAIVANASLEVLAARGMRGLTHRAVDEEAGLPYGSTSNLARTREALMELALSRLAEIEEKRFGEFPVGDLGQGPQAFADFAAQSIHTLINEDRRFTQARYEMALEATRNPKLRTAYDELGILPRRYTTELLAKTGFTEVKRRGAVLVSMIDGIMFDAIVGAGGQLSLDELRSSLREVLEGMWRLGSDER